MRFAFSDEQRLLQRTVRELLEKECTPQQVRAAGATESGRVPGLWRKLAETGVTGLVLPERSGGLGLGDTGIVLILEEAGRASLPEPLIATYAGGALLASVGDDQWPPLIAAGDAAVGVGLGQHFVPYADTTSVLLLQDGEDLFVVPRERAKVVRQPSLDPTTPLFTVEWSRGDATKVLPDAASIAFDAVAFAASAMLLGIASRVIEMAASYAKEREQFGRPIGEFQAVKHMLANAFVRVEFARPVVYRAALSLEAGAPERSRDASHAKAAASEAASMACRTALQVHGAIGYTEEHDLHLWLRKGRALISAWGDAAWHRAKLASIVLR